MKRSSEVDRPTVSEPAFMPNRTSGPNVSSRISSATDYFLLFYDAICTNNNSYAKDKYKYRGTKCYKFYVVFGMGLHPRADYFS